MSSDSNFSNTKPILNDAISNEVVPNIGDVDNTSEQLDLIKSISEITESAKIELSKVLETSPKALLDIATKTSDDLISINSASDRSIKPITSPQQFDLQIGEQVAAIDITANALQTIQIQLS